MCSRWRTGKEHLGGLATTCSYPSDINRVIYTAWTLSIRRFQQGDHSEQTTKAIKNAMSDTINAMLRSAIPRDRQNGLNALAEILAAVANGHLVPDAAAARIIADPNLAQALRMLQGQTLQAADTTFTFSTDTITIGSIHGSEAIAVGHGAIAIKLNIYSSYALDDQIDLARRKYLRAFISDVTSHLNDRLELGDFVPIPVEFVSSLTDEAEVHHYEDITYIPTPLTKLLISGEAGSGKSTLLYKLSLDAARRSIADDKAPVPIFIELWQWNAPGHLSSKSFLDSVIRTNEYSPLGEFLRLLEQSSNSNIGKNLLFLLDGFDEVRGNALEFLQKWIQDTKDNVILTCRTEYVGLLEQLNMPLARLTMLTDRQISLHAKRHLGNERAEIFLSRAIGTRTGEFFDAEKVLAGLARSPFFFSLMLLQFKETGKVTFNRWELIMETVRRLWKRVQKHLITDPLKVSYLMPESIIKPLSLIAFQYIDTVAIPIEIFEKYIPRDVLHLMVRTGLIQVSSESARFRHQVFVEYFAANKLLENSNLRPFAQGGSTWIGALVMLAGESAQRHSDVQEALIQSIPPQTSFLNIFEEDFGPMSAISEIGDETTLNRLLDLHHQTSIPFDDILLTRMYLGFPLNIGRSVRTLLITIGRVAARLPENSMTRQKAVDVMEKLLTLEPGTDYEGINYNREIDEYGNYLSSVIDEDGQVQPVRREARNDDYYEFCVWNSSLAIAELGTLQAARLLLRGLAKFAEHKPGYQPFRTNVYRKGFALAFARIGRPAIPVLLEALESDDETIPLVAVEALTLISHAVPLMPLERALATHPDPIVCYWIAQKLGQMKAAEAVPHLIAALNDNSSWRQGIALGESYYHYVADSAAEALAKIGSDEGIAAILERAYDVEGRATINLALRRLIDEQRFVLRVHWARYIVSRLDGMSTLFPLLGKLLTVPNGFDPIAEALSSERSLWDESNLQSLLSFIDSTDDIEARSIAITLLGRKRLSEFGPAHHLLAYLSTENMFYIRSSAAHGLGILVSEQESLPPNLEHIIDIMFDIIDGSDGNFHEGIGIGIVYFAKAALKNAPQAAIRIIDRLLDRLSSPRISISKIASVSLERLLLGIDVDTQLKLIEKEKQYTAIRLDEFRRMVSFSPTYLMQAGNQLLDRGMRFEDEEEIKLAIEQYSECLKLKNQSILSWSSGYSESDWIQLGCGEGMLHFFRGEAFYGLGQLHDAYTDYRMATELLGADTDYSVERYKPMRAKAALRAGAVLVNDDRDLEQALEFFQIAIKVDSQPGNGKLLSLALIGEQIAYMKLKNWQKAIDVGLTALKILHSARGYFEEECTILSYTAQAYNRAGNSSDAIHLLDRGEHRARMLGLRSSLADILILRADLRNRCGDFVGASQDIVAAKEVFEDAQDWQRAANVLIEAAESVYDDNQEQALPLLEEAYSFLNRARRETDPTRTASLLDDLGLIYSALRRHAQAEICFKQAIELLRSKSLLSELPSILVNYGLDLHAQGRTDEGVNLVMQAAELGLDPQEIEVALYKMNTNPAWHLPSATVDALLDNTFEVLTQTPDNRREFQSHLERMLDQARSLGYAAETEFLSSIVALLEHQEFELPESNPYHEAFEQLIARLNKAAFIQEVLKKTMDVLRSDNSEHKKEWTGVVAALIPEAMLKGDTRSAGLLTGVFAYLIDMSIEEAEKRLLQESVRVMRFLDRALRRDKPIEQEDS